jgi:hypothetical protein
MLEDGSMPGYAKAERTDKKYRRLFLAAILQLWPMIPARPAAPHATYRKRLLKRDLLPLMRVAALMQLASLLHIPSPLLLEKSQSEMLEGQQRNR